GIYDASAGDYPVYRNGDPLAIPKVMAWTVFNDAGLIHTHSGGDNLNVEIHQTSWMLNADNFPALNHTLFRKDRLINKNAEPIDSFHLGMWYTGAIGCFMDDYTGSIPELNTFYFYNSSDFDPDCGDPGYGDNPPVLAHIFLDANMTSFLSYETTFTPTGIPENAVDHYEYLSGSWKDANLVEYGGSGYLQGTYPYPFMYPTNPNDTTQGAWSETLEMNPPGSRQVVGSTGPYYFDVGSIFEFDHAIYFLQDSALNHLETVDALYDIVPDIQTSHTNQYANVQMTPICVEDCVWPGDTNTDGIVDVLDVLQFANNNGYCDAARSKVSIEWTSFFNPAWPDTFDLAEGIRIEHIDCDGDGMIAPLTDMQAVVANYGETNFYFEGLSGGDVPGQVLSFQARSTDGTLIDELPLQEYHVIDMLLNLPAEEQGKIVGVAFNLTVESSNGELETTILSTPANTFDVQLALKESPTELAFGAVSSVGTPIPGSPDLILLRLIGYVDAFTDDCTVGIQISNVQAIRDDGSMLTLGNEDKVWPIAGCATTNTEDPLASDIIIDILPNPASEKVLIQTNGLQVLDLEVYDLMGRRVAVPLTWDENPSLYVNHLPKGMYLVHLQTDQGAVTKRLMVQR
ncbi:MAG: T9SS type A sorting domain-containing protein, partial [Bacteroidota bacterium]